MENIFSITKTSFLFYNLSCQDFPFTSAILTFDTLCPQLRVLCENERVEYALAIYIHPYPNDVLSVWLYIASLIPK